MNKALRIMLIVIGILVVAGSLVFVGTLIGRRTAFGLGWPQSPYGMMNYYNRPGRNVGQGMMRESYTGGYGMMGGRNGYGMMGGYGYSNTSTDPLTIDQAYQAAETYLTTMNNPDLSIAEVMVFDNNAYVRVNEQSTGIGAFELLVDPSSLVVFPEHGPNMMWNLKYGGLNHQTMMGGRGGMMGTSFSSSIPADVTATMPITSDQAIQAAQQYIDITQPGTTTALDADPFYGYYTIDFLRDGKIIGMLSVNGFSSQVFIHTWHGTFIATQDY